MDLISVVVPIYNVEKYLEVCIQSIINQTYTHLEIILVDDGSPDLCPQICDDYQKKDSRIKVIHKKNGGLSDARNAGLEIATGKYITFIDSDDYVEYHFIESLYQAIKEKNADISFCDYKQIQESFNDNIIPIEQDQYKDYTNKECLKNLYQPTLHGFEFVAWGKLYDINLFRQYDIEYPVGQLHEDTYTTYKLIYHASHITFVSNPYYFYRMREGSIMNTKFNTKNLTIREATRQMVQFYNEHNEPELLSYALNMHLVTMLKLIYEINTHYSEEDQDLLSKRIVNEYKKDLKEYKRKGHLDFKHRLFYTCMSIYPSTSIIKKRYHLG